MTKTICQACEEVEATKNGYCSECFDDLHRACECCREHFADEDLIGGPFGSVWCVPCVVRAEAEAVHRNETELWLMKNR